MFLVHDKFRFLCTPRTGSRAVCEALKAFPHTEELPHHDHPADVSEDELPLITVIRDPYEQTLSWYGHIVLRHEPERESVEDFADFIRNTQVQWYFTDELNPYALNLGNVHLVRFSKDNRDLLVEHIISKANSLNSTNDVPVSGTPWVGGNHTPSPELLTKETRLLIEQRFPKDIELWNGFNY